MILRLQRSIRNVLQNNRTSLEKIIFLSHALYFVSRTVMLLCLSYLFLNGMMCFPPDYQPYVI